MSAERAPAWRLSDVARAPLGVVRAVERRSRRAAADAVIAAADAWLSSSELDRIVTAIVEHEGSARLADRVLASPLARHVGRQTVDSGALDAVLDRLVEREAFWALVDVVAGSAAVGEAIGRQSRSAVTDVVDGVRDGAAQADDWLERVALRVVGRRRVP
ncbi:MAG: hypothetical protein ITG02_06140 [Patulibacter sp.]|nr:hypothetical protein [Patulibacter sp.]